MTRTKEVTRRILANKIITNNRKALGELAEKSVKNITEKNTYFSKEQLSALIVEGITRMVGSVPYQGAEKDDWKASIDLVDKQLFKTLTETPDLCPSFDLLGGDKLYSAPDLRNGEAVILDSALRMSENKNKGLSEVNIYEIDKAYRSHAASHNEVEERAGAIRDVLSVGNLKIIDAPENSGKEDVLAGIAVGLPMTDGGMPMVITAGASNKSTGEISKQMQKSLNNISGNKAEVFESGMENLLTSLDKGNVKPKTFIVVDKAEQLGTRDMSRLLGGADKAGAKVLLIGDSKRYVPKESGVPYRMILEELPEIKPSVLNDVEIQKDGFEKGAVRNLRAGNVKDVLTSYVNRDALVFEENSNDTLKQTAEDYVSWQSKDENKNTSASIIVSDRLGAAKVNAMVREGLKKTGVIGEGNIVETPNGMKEFAVGEKIVFGEKLKASSKKGDSVLDAGTTGSVLDVGDNNLTLKLDSGKTVKMSSKYAGAVEYAYAVDIRKAMDVSCDKTFLAVTDKMDSAKAVVAFSRHKNKITTRVSKSVYKNIDEMANDLSLKDNKKMVSDRVTPWKNPPRQPRKHRTTLGILVSRHLDRIR